MIDPSQPLHQKKEALEALVRKAREKVKNSGASTSEGKSTLEQQQLEGAQDPEEKALNDLKSAVESLASAVESIDTRAKDLENARTEQLLDMREVYARKAYRFVWLWSIALIVILILQGAKYPHFKLWILEFKAADFSLDSKIVIALITGVTVNIVAVFIVVMRNLFPSEAKEAQKDRKSDAKE
ncbi:hypothetical protein PUG42_06075 [Erwiniaceae bacterium L1_54_3]|nr:hypothetical protein [Erwiniaceae bacterium L1_54_3]